MSKRFIAFGLILLAGVSCGIGWLAVTKPPLPPARSIMLEVAPLSSANSVSGIYTVIVSNASNYPVTYAEGFNTILFTIAYMSNGVWQTFQVTTPGSDAWLLAPHGVVTDAIQVPEAASVFKVGLSITSLTWRGQFAFRMSGSRFSEHFKPLMGFLLVQDRERRSKTEWSDEQKVAHE